MDGLPTSALSDIFETEPVPLSAFLYDTKYLGLGRQKIQLSEIQFDFIRHFEQVYSPETYIALVEQLGEDWMPVRHVHTVIAPWGKGCHAPYTPVYNADTGQWQRLDSFKSANVAAAHKEDGIIGKHVGTDAFKEGEGQMYRVTTSSGLVEDVYGGHKYLQRYETRGPSGSVKYDRKLPYWSKVWDLKVGDHIAVAGTLPEPSKIFTTTDAWVEWVGLFLGDGNCTQKTQVNICGGVGAPLTKQRVEDLYEELGYDYRMTTRVEKNNKWYGYVKSPRDPSTPTMRERLRELGLEGKYAWEKFIPEDFYSLPNRQVALLLSRLIDTDGSVYIKKYRHKRTPVIEYASKSKALTEGVLRLFRRLGVFGRMRRKWVPYAYPDGRTGDYSHILEITQAQEVVKAGQWLTLLDKQELFNMILAEAEVKSRQRWRYGDLIWDRITSIEPLGIGEYWTLTVDGPHCYIAGGGLLSHNSGKDMVCRFSISRVADLLLNLRSPQSYFGIPDTDEIQMLNVAVAAGQAQTAFFRPLRNMLVKSPRFADQFRAGVPGDNAKTIALKKNLELISGHSEAESQEGMNLIAAIADEIGAFKTESETKVQAGRVSAQTADYIIDMLRSSASTRFPNNYKLGLISYPRYEGDAIMRAHEEGLRDNDKFGDKSKFYVSGPYATWEVNPRVTKENFAEDYERDPEFAQAKYECKPPKAADRYIRSDAAIYSGFHREEDPVIEVEYVWDLPKALPNEHLGELSPGWQAKFFISPDLVPIDGAIYSLHGDIALRQDAAGIAMSHVSQYRVSPYENGQEAPQPVVKVDFVTSFTADLAAEVDGVVQPREVKLDWYRQLVFELMSRGFTIGRVTFDGFASAGLIQQFNEYGIESEVVSLDRNTSVYDNFKDVLYSGRLDAPRDIKTIDELMKLTKVSHRKIDHLPNGSKDRADAVAGSVFGAIQCGGSEGESPTAVDLTWENAYDIDRSFTVDLSLHPQDLGFDSVTTLPFDADLSYDYSNGVW